MSKQNIVRGIVVVLFCSLGAYAVSLRLENAELRSRLGDADVEGAVVADGSTVGVDEEAVGALVEENKAAAGEAAALVVDEGPTPEEIRAQQRREERRERMGRFVASFDNPEERMALLDREMGQIDQRYARFFATLDLSTDEIEKLKTIMGERNVLAFEKRMKARYFESEDDVAAMSAEIDGQRDLLNGALVELIGEDGREAMDTFKKQEPYRERVEVLENSLSYTDAPIDENQRDGLVAVYAAADEGFEYTKDLSDRRNFRGQDISEEDVNTFLAELESRNSSVLVGASALLNEEQLANLAEQQLSERMQLERRLNFQLEGGRGGRGGPGGPGGRGR